MSVRIQNLAAVVIGTLAVACSKPPAEPADPPTPTETTPAPAPDQPLVSAIEAGQGADLQLVRPAEKKPPRQVVVKGTPPRPSLDIGEVTPTVATASQAPAAEVPMDLAMAPAPRGPSPGGEGSGGGGVGQEPGLFPERGMGGPGTIIIRGGMGGIEDDCKRHPNGAVGFPGAAPGIAINNRMPELGSGGVMANNPSRRPLTPGRMGGTGGIGVGRRGIR